MKIYTKQGDDGSTHLEDPHHFISKASLKIDVCGNIDELNSFMGLLRDTYIDPQIQKDILIIQNKLFFIGAIMSSPLDIEKNNLIKKEDTQFLEKQIDFYTKPLPLLRNFVLPGGHPTISHIHITRAICRRLERKLVLLTQEYKWTFAPLVLPWINRLSDYLFTISRKYAYDHQIQEILWNSSQE